MIYLIWNFGYPNSVQSNPKTEIPKVKTINEKVKGFTWHILLRSL